MTLTLGSIGAPVERGRFVGRRAALRQFEGALAQVQDLLPDDELEPADLLFPHVFLVVGGAGMGKSAVLRQFELCCRTEEENGAVVVAIDWEPELGRGDAVALLRALHDALFRLDFGDEWEQFRAGLERWDEVRRQVGDAQLEYVTHLSARPSPLVEALRTLRLDLDTFSVATYGLADGLADVDDPFVAYLRQRIDRDQFDLLANPAILGTAFAEGMNRSASRERPLVVLLEFADGQAHLAAWLRRWVLPHSGPHVLWVLAGDFGAAEVQRFRDDFPEELLVRAPLERFSRIDVSGYLRQHSPRPGAAPNAAFVSAVHEAGGGAPLAVELMASMHKVGVDVKILFDELRQQRAPLVETIEPLVEGFLDYCIGGKGKTQLEADAQRRHGRWIFCLAVLRRFDEPAFAEMSAAMAAQGERDPEGIRRELREHYSFLFGAAKKRIHPLVKRALRRRLAASAPTEEQTRAARAAVDYYRNLVQEHAGDLDVRRRHEVLAWQDAVLDHLNALFWADRSGQEGLAAFVPAYLEALAFSRPLAESLLQLVASFAGVDPAAGELLQALAQHPLHIRAAALLRQVGEIQQQALPPREAFAAFVGLLEQDAEARRDRASEISSALEQLSARAGEWSLGPLQRGLIEVFRGRHLAGVGQLNQALAAFGAAGSFVPQATELRPTLAASLSQLGWQSTLARGRPTASETAERAFSRAAELEPLNGYHRIGLGAAQYASREFEAALESLRKGVDLDGERSYALNWLGRSEYMLRHFGKALAAHQRALELEPGLVDGHVGHGDVLLRLGHPDQALAAFQRAAELDALFPVAHKGLGDAYTALGRRQAAVEAYQRAIELDPQVASAHSGLGNLYVKFGQYEDAQAAFERALAVGGLDEAEIAVVHHGLGSAHFHQGRHAEAVAAYKYSLELDPRLAESQVGLGEVYLKLGRHAEAAMACQRAVEIDAQLPAAHNALAKVYRAQGKPEEAIAAHRRAIELNPDYAAPHTELGSLYAELDRYSEAIGAFQKAFELSGLNEYELALAYMGLGGVYHGQGSLSQAVDAYQQALALDVLDDKNLALVYRELGELQRALGLLDESVDAYKRAIDVGVLGGHDLAVVHNGLGTVYRIQRQYEDAVVSYRLATVLDPKYALPHNGLGNIHYVRGDHQEAIAAYKRALALDPGYASPHNGLGNVYADLGRHEEAIGAYRRAIEIGGVDDHELAIFYNGLGNSHADAGDAAAAVEAYRRAIELDPDYAYPYSGLGGAYADLEEHEAALQAFRQAVELGGLGDPELAVVFNGIGNAQRALGEYQKAIAAYQQAIVLHPKNPAPHTGLGMVCATTGDYDAAFAAYQRAIELGGLSDHDLAVVYAGLGNVYVATRRYGQAAHAFQRATDLGVLTERELAIVLNDLGDARIALGQHAEAVSDFERATELDPQYAAAHSGLGAARHLLGRHDEALAAFRWAIELDPDNAHAHNGMGQALLAKKDYSSAESAFQQAIEQDARFAASYGGLGAVYNARGEYGLALSAYERAIELDPHDPRHWGGRGHVLAATGRHEEALAAYQRAIGMGSLPSRDLAAVHNGLGNIHRTLGRADQAMESYQQAIILYPSYAIPHCGLGVVYLEQGRLQEARSAFERALKLGGLEPREQAPVRYYLGKVHTLLGNSQEAMAALQNATEADPDLARVHVSLAAGFRRRGDEAAFDTQIERARALSENASDYDQACLEGLCGRVDYALDLLDSALEKKQATVAWARRDPDLQALRDSPRFEAVVQEYSV